MVAVAALLFVVVSGLVNPRTRPFVIGLGLLSSAWGLYLPFLLQLHWSTFRNHSVRKCDRDRS